VKVQGATSWESTHRPYDNVEEANDACDSASVRTEVDRLFRIGDVHVSMDVDAGEDWGDDLTQTPNRFRRGDVI
jgi:hypothetical protein